MLVFPISKYLNKLLQDCRLTACTSLCELSRVVIVTKHLIIMFIVAILGPKDRWTRGAGKMLYMVFSIQGGNIRSTESTSALVAEKIQPSEVINLTQWIFRTTISVLDRKEFRCYNFSAVLMSALAFHSLLFYIQFGRLTRHMKHSR